LIYDLRHLTTYTYEKAVTFARCALRLAPHDGDDQEVTNYRLAITPEPTQMQQHIGAFGERVVTATIETPHKELKILAESQVSVNRAALARPLGRVSWEAVRDDAFNAYSLDLASPAHFLYPTEMTAIHSAITDYAAKSFAPGRPVVEAAYDLACRIKADFAYDPKSTEVSTPAIEAFTARHGVCQDFAQIMISGLKGLGLPAAYVSGYLRTIPAPGRPRLEGADATHAWTNLWCGGAQGWIGFDPTNALVVADDHIVLAVGRDYADVAPIGGVVLGPGKQTIEVGVDVIPHADSEPGMMKAQ
jgi:transglutaminase-like putative cysteine protease